MVFEMVKEKLCIKMDIFIVVVLKMTFMKEKASISLVSTLIIRVILIREKGRAKAL